MNEVVSADKLKALQDIFNQEECMDDYYLIDIFQKSVKPLSECTFEEFCDEDTVLIYFYF